MVFSIMATAMLPSEQVPIIDITKYTQNNISCPCIYGKWLYNKQDNVQAISSTSHWGPDHPEFSIQSEISNDCITVSAENDCHYASVLGKVIVSTLC